jgi:glycosyltransferase involved in cell wall biosynthesis
MTALSIVFGFRDRDIQRVERCLASLARQTFTDFEVIFVDYGSQRQTAQAVQRVVEQYPFARYIYTETRGYPWNRSHALNIGGKLASGEYLMTTDVDMIYAPDLLEVFMTHAADNLEIHIIPHLLPENFSDWDNVAAYRGRFALGPDNMLGACQMIATRVFREMRGYDEYYRYYGVEDRDINHRLRLLGIEEKRLTNKTAMFHQWHPVVDFETRAIMPDTIWSRMQIHYHVHVKDIIRNDENWGQIHTRADRPVFRFVDADANTLIEQECLHFINLDPKLNVSVARLAFDFTHSLPANHAYAVNHAFFPRRSQQAEQVFQMMNKLLRLLRLPGIHADYAPNRLHSYIHDFIDEKHLLADYYLNLPVKDGITVLVRASE